MQSSLVPVATVGKIPGDLHEMPLDGRVTIQNLFTKLGLTVDRCDIQRNGTEADLADFVEPGDTILAIVKIRGNQ